MQCFKDKIIDLLKHNVEFVSYNKFELITQTHRVNAEEYSAAQILCVCVCVCACVCVQVYAL